MKAYFSPATRLHRPRFFLMRGRVIAHEDHPDRVTRCADGAVAAGLELVEAAPACANIAASVHTARYVHFLESAWAAWQRLPEAGPEVLGNVQPRDAAGAYPDHIVARAGWHLGDLACPISEGTAAAAFAAAGCAVAAADALTGGATAAYALCRPPGHHASAEVAGGHCYLNNTAIAAERLASGGRRVAILDMDVHHGNGTQAIFYGRGDVLFVSVHADTAAFYPWFVGHADERGVQAGVGATLNLPLPVGSGDAPWLGALGRALEAIRVHNADVLVVSAGFDVHAADPLAGMRVTTDAIAEAGHMIAATHVPAVIVQEGGYMSDALTRNVAAFLCPFAARGRV